jgi:4-hydroxy-2-oxoheptanedioate aldolase
MPAIRNIAREKLERNELSLGCGVRLTRSVEIAIAMKAAGFDWLFLDLEHGTMSIDAAAQIATAALDAGIAPLARVPNGDTPSPRVCSTTAYSELSCRTSILQMKHARWCRN